MKKEWKFSTNNFKKEFVYYLCEESKMGVENQQYNAIYGELCQLIGENNMKKLHGRYQGLTIQFPRKLYSVEHIRNFINENQYTMSIKDISRTLNLTDRRVRQIMKELK